MDVARRKGLIDLVGPVLTVPLPSDSAFCQIGNRVAPDTTLCLEEDRRPDEVAGSEGGR